MKHSYKETRKQGDNQPGKKHKKHQLLTNKASGHSRGRQPKEQTSKAPGQQPGYRKPKWMKTQTRCEGSSRKAQSV